MAPQVLLVEDDLAMQRLVTKWVSGAGYELTSVRNGRDAITMIEACCPHIVITARELPIMDGLQLCNWIRRQHLPRYVYTIVCSSRYAIADIMRCMENGADDLLKKPLDRADLFMRLTAGLRVGQLEQRIHDSAQLDSLTDVASQRRFFERLGEEWKRADRYQLPLSCVMLDIDLFEQLNRTHGHLIGDVVIRTVAETLKENTRGSDFIGRYGGDKFCILLPETNESQAVAWSERVRKAVARRNMSIREQEVRFSISLGVAQYTADRQHPSDLLAAAQDALRMAKHAGRNQAIGHSATTMSDEQADGQGMRQAMRNEMQDVPCRQLMIACDAPLQDSDAIVDCVSFFSRHRSSLAPVVDGEGRLTGVAFENDVMLAMLDDAWRSRPIRDLQRPVFASFDAESKVVDVYEFLTKVPTPAAIVMSDERPVGILTREVALRWRAAMVDASSQENTETDAHLGPLDERLENALTAIEQEVERLRNCAPSQLGHEVLCGVSRIEPLLPELALAATGEPDTSQPTPFNPHGLKPSP